ncbi:hypothetical protein SAMN05444920_112195 [Nonomuraea solani]|uniref:Uncharacterized protein n=1 Tax=Nonomuraea solani TaxID=1144553 RepID=A0A1H6EQR7_9ACTN|nr:hypothetical protein [Nonomuraea solani]SEG99054.1 hypothetical protein SAMN05444920_112195 [Nonomuraea solani]
MSLADEEMAEAAGLVGAARGIRRSVGAPPPAGERLDVGRITRRACEALGEEAVASGE